MVLVHTFVALLRKYLGSYDSLRVTNRLRRVRKGNNLFVAAFNDEKVKIISKT